MWFMTALILSDAQAVALEKRWLAGENRNGTSRLSGFTR